MMRARLGSRLRFTLVLAVAVMAAFSVGLGRDGQAVPRAHADTTPQIDFFKLPPHQGVRSGLTGIAAGPDNALWFGGIYSCGTDIGSPCSQSNNVGRITTDGIISEFSFGGFNYLPISIALGSDNNLWVTGGDANDLQHFGPPFVGKLMPPLPGSFTANSTPYPINDPCSAPGGITAGANGALWFTDTTGCDNGETGTSKVRQITTGGAMPPPIDLGHPGLLRGITLGPDENGDRAIWFSEYNAVGRIGASGIPSQVVLGASSCASDQITTGADHNLWFVDACVGGTADSIDRMSVLGVVTQFPVPTGSAPQGIVSAPDGKLWFTLASGFVGSIDPNNAFTSMQLYPLPSPGVQPEAITVGPDGNLWFQDVGASAIGRVTLNPLTVTKVDPSSGAPDGGTKVTISGTNFSTTFGATSFNFGPNPATEVSCSSTVQCSAKAPKGTGTVDVIAKLNGAISPPNLSDKYTYSPITLTVSDPNVRVGNPVFFNGSGWNPAGGPIQIVYDDHVNPKVIKTLPAAATFFDSTPATYAHPTTAVWGCTATLRARQDGVERTVDIQTGHPEAALLTDGQVYAGVDDGTGHLNPVRLVQAPDYICGGEAVGVSPRSTVVGFQLDEAGIKFAGSGSGSGYAWVNVSAAQGGAFGITFDDDAAKSRAMGPMGPGMVFRPGVSFCLGVYGNRTVAIVLSRQAGAPPATQLFAVPAKCDQNVGTTSSVGTSRVAAAAIPAAFPADRAFDPCRAAGLPDVPANLNGQALSGVYLHHGDLTISQPLTLNQGTLCVDGNLQLRLGVSGTGSLLVNGGLAVSGPFALTGLNGIVSDITGNATIAGPDTTPPTTTAVPSPPATGTGWFTAPTSVSLTSTDDVAGSGVGTTYYALDTATCTPAAKAACSVYSGTPLNVASDGRHTLTYFSVDIAGNVEAPHTLPINLDTVAPITTLIQKGSACATVVTLTATDATSGVAYIETNLDGGAWQRYGSPVTVRGGHTLHYRAVDVAGNVEAAHSFTVSGTSTGRCPSPFG